MDIIYNFIKRLINHLTFNSTDNDHSIKQGEKLPMNYATDVVKAISTYIDKPDTKYAIMIDGDWGCGKTFLWDNYIYPTIGKKEAIYVSVFGLKDVNDIENELFKTISMVGVDKEGSLKGLLNSNTELLDDIKFGGLGYAVQFGLNKYKENRLKKTKRLFLCFDDIERWSGKIEVFLSYINKLVEHEGAKCLLIGSSKGFGEKKDNFTQYKEKTIKFIYRLNYKPTELIAVAKDISSYSTEESKKYIENILYQNIERISNLLLDSKCSNIRTLSTAIYYFDFIYNRNTEKFNLSPTNSISYFICLLSTLILVEHYKNSDKDRKEIFDPSLTNSNVPFLLERLGIEQYDENNEPKEHTGDNKIVESLVEEIFYQSHEIKLQGIFSVITNGFYREIDFEDAFSSWKKTEDWEFYINTYNYWHSEDEEAKRIYKNTYSSMLIEKNITDPSILIVLTDRLTTDIKRGVIDLPFDETKDKIRELFNELYDSKRMDYVKHIGFMGGTRTFDYCKDIYDEIKEMNNVYYESREKYELSRFWESIKENPDSMDDLMDKYKRLPLFSMYEKPNDITETIYSLDNNKLFKLLQWMGHRLNEDQQSRKAVDDEYDRAQIISEIIENDFGEKHGIRASHLRHIAKVIRNKRTEYDPEYIDKIKEKERKAKEKETL